jgi:hypothetical protein
MKQDTFDTLDNEWHNILVVDSIFIDNSEENIMLVYR